MSRRVPLNSAEGRRLVEQGPAWREHPDYYREEPEEEDMECGDPLTPPRGPLSPEVEAAARFIHREVWGESYRPGEGPMHYAGGPYWRNWLVAQAGIWEEMARAARTCAEALPS
jgi:hypothetical protein